jgi:putative transposase
MQNLMRCTSLRVICQKPRTTIPGDPSECYLCLADIYKDTVVDQIWSTEITYIPLQRGFLYLVTIVDLFSRNERAQLETL